MSERYKQSGKPNKSSKIRLKELIKLRFPLLSGDEILASILCGEVKVDGESSREPHQMIGTNTSIVIEARQRFVSRGGEKLDSILGDWGIPVDDQVFIDAGCAHGGFTDCLLRRGARLVHAVDVGYNQLDYSLRNHRRVKVYERTNIMRTERSHFIPRADAAVVDLSFRSIVGAGSHILGLVKRGWLISLVKPQFEWRMPNESFRGVVTDPKDRLTILSDLLDMLWQGGSYVTRVAPSAIEGRKGNREYFFLIKNHAELEIAEIKKKIERLRD